ncbi:hypothetical protein QFZ94_006057 [Paraburkholderia sp. JPY465]|uniref:hypothetical protein n=1 Tax=Paraburkholderia sp. JPY465 TaxID=3042285 RepID=UPI003D2284DD
MSTSARGSTDHRSLDDARLQYVLRRAAVAAILFDCTSARALLDFPDAEVGRLFKIQLAQVIGLSTALHPDLCSIPGEHEKQLSRAKRGSKRRRSESEHSIDRSASNAARHSLVGEGKLLRTAVICEALGITEQRLGKDVAAGRIFSVDVETTPYYPAFFVAKELDRRDLAKVVRKLGELTDWGKWKFFTEPNASLDNLTPLRALMDGGVKQVLRAAAAFAKR